MAEVSLNIDGRSYAIACDDGQERRLQELGSYVDERIRQVSGGGAVNKAQSMILASLVLADEVYDLQDRLGKASQAVSEANQSAEMARAEVAGVSASGATHVIEYQGLAPVEEQNIINLIGQMASKVEKLTARVQRKSA